MFWRRGRAGIDKGGNFGRLGWMEEISLQPAGITGDAIA